jgi:hypothetical protein
MRLLTAVFLALGLFAAIAGARATGAPGTLVSVEAMPGAPEGATAYRILYWSTDIAGEPIEVSGVVVAPEGDAPPSGRPVVAWAHPTTGVVSRCAPSLARVFFGSGTQQLRQRPATSANAFPPSVSS